MGWDAHAVKTKGHIAKFKAAAKMVVEECGSVDYLLARGSLDCSACARSLEEATGGYAWDEFGWTAEQVKAYSERAIWPDMGDINPDKRWAYLSAKAFLDVCAKIGTGISFSY